MSLFEYLQNKKTYVIAEMSANHAQDLMIALQMVNAAKCSGADCIKVQTYTPETLTIKSDNNDFMISDGLWQG